LNPLTITDLQHYVQHRLTLAGGSGRPHFTTWAMRALHRASDGIPRIVNNLCDKALLAAFIRESDEVTYWDMRRAIKELRALTE
jgi:general secretion pathway protein A